MKGAIIATKRTLPSTSQKKTQAQFLSLLGLPMPKDQIIISLINIIYKSNINYFDITQISLNFHPTIAAIGQAMMKAQNFDEIIPALLLDKGMHYNRALSVFFNHIRNERFTLSGVTELFNDRIILTNPYEIPIADKVASFLPLNVYAARLLFRNPAVRDSDAQIGVNLEPLPTQRVLPSHASPLAAERISFSKTQTGNSYADAQFVTPKTTLHSIFYDNKTGLKRNESGNIITFCDTNEADARLKHALAVIRNQQRIAKDLDIDIYEGMGNTLENFIKSNMATKAKSDAFLSYVFQTLEKRTSNTRVPIINANPANIYYEFADTIRDNDPSYITREVALYVKSQGGLPHVHAYTDILDRALVQYVHVFDLYNPIE